MVILTFQAYSITVKDTDYETETLNLKTIFWHDMLGGLHSCRQTQAGDIWTFRFKGIGYSKVDELITFMRATSGGQIRVEHDTAGIFFGTIIGDPFEANRNGTGYCYEDNYEFELKIEQV